MFCHLLFQAKEIFPLQSLSCGIITESRFDQYLRSSRAEKSVRCGDKAKNVLVVKEKFVEMVEKTLKKKLSREKFLNSLWTLFKIYSSQDSLISPAP